MLTRRNFLSGAAAGALAAAIPNRSRAVGEMRKKVAFLGTEVRTHSHAQHFLDRMTLGYGWHGKWQMPRVEVASVFIDQFPERDLARERIKRHNLKQFPTIAEALTLGGEKLAVDGVVVIAEHGKYPSNEKGQKLYPRYEWFKEVVKVFDHFLEPLVALPALRVVQGSGQSL
ncbi:MAG TPA: twin-arginine translocation signal domain-containing protein [Pirellulales bacterium]|nr:twin-arginine translocation signal domain-containing protein [Pirellulales bacterium]